MQSYAKASLMSLKIENEETRRLACELASLTGETVSKAITVALRERLERVRHERSVEGRLQGMRHQATHCSPAARRAVGCGEFNFGMIPQSSTRR